MPCLVFNSLNLNTAEWEGPFEKLPDAVTELSASHPDDTFDVFMEDEETGQEYIGTFRQGQLILFDNAVEKFDKRGLWETQPE